MFVTLYPFALTEREISLHTLDPKLTLNWRMCVPCGVLLPVQGWAPCDPQKRLSGLKNEYKGRFLFCSSDTIQYSCTPSSLEKKKTFWPDMNLHSYKYS